MPCANSDTCCVTDTQQRRCRGCSQNIIESPQRRAGETTLPAHIWTPTCSRGETAGQGVMGTENPTLVCHSSKFSVLLCHCHKHPGETLFGAGNMQVWLRQQIGLSSGWAGGERCMTAKQRPGRTTRAALLLKCEAAEATQNSSLSSLSGQSADVGFGGVLGSQESLLRCTSSFAVKESCVRTFQTISII